MRYFFLFKENKITILKIFIFTILSILVYLSLIPLSQKLTKVFLNKSLKNLFELGIYVILIYLLRGFFFFFQNFITSNLAIKITNDIKLELYRLIIFSNYEKIKNQKIGNIINTINNDIIKIRELIISFLIELIPSLLMILCTLVYIFYLNWKLSILIFILISSISIFINYFSSKIKFFSKKSQEINSEIINHINEDLINFYILKNLGIEELRFNSIKEKQKLYNSNLLNTFKNIYLQPSVIGVLQVTGIVVIAIFSMYQMIIGNISIEELISFGTAITLTIEPAIFITNSIGKISKYTVSFERVFKLLQFYKVTKKDIECNVNKYNISIKSLSYTMDNKNIIKNINIEIKEGQSIIISGNNGVGKSTLISIIGGIYKNYQGSVKIGNHEINNISNEFLIKNVRISCHEPFIFSGTIKDNILLGNNKLLENDLNEICNILEIKDYTKNVGTLGNALSSGQKQRISIARAIASKPLILILDEALSAIDKESEIKIYNKLRKYLKNSTFIIISHRKINLDFIDFELQI